MTVHQTLPKSPLSAVSDPRLVRSFSYIGGKWCRAEDGSAFAVTNPADGQWLGEVASLSGAESTARRGCGAGSLRHLVEHPAAGAGAPAAPLVRAHDRAPRGSGPDHGSRAGQADLRSARRDHLCRRFRRILRRRDPPPEYRGRDLASGGCRSRALARAGRRGGSHHAVELSRRDADPQGCRRAGGRLHRGLAPVGGNAVFGAGAGRTGRARRVSRQACSTS